MTHHTDAERAEFEAWARGYGTWEVKRDDDVALGTTGYTDLTLTVAWHAVQAAHRAPETPTAENIRDGAPYDNQEFEQLARDMGVWGTAQSAVCAQFWLAATQPAAQGMEAQQYRLIERGELIEAGDQFLRDDFTWQIDPRGIFVGVQYGAALRPARRAIAAQAKQGGAA